MTPSQIITSEATRLLVEVVSYPQKIRFSGLRGILSRKALMMMMIFAGKRERNGELNLVVY